MIEPQETLYIGTKWYDVDTTKLTSVKDIAELFTALELRVIENSKNFDKVKKFLITPEPPKSLKEIQQEFHEKIDELIEQTKRNFYASNLTAERKYNDFCDRQDSAFEYMQKNGRPPVKYVIDYSKVYLNSSSSNEIITTLNPEDVVGYYKITQGFLLGVKQKPSKLVRFFMKTLLNWRWKDA